MSPKSAILLTSFACMGAAVAQPVIPGFDFTKAYATFSGGMDIDNRSGDLDVYTLGARSALSQPISPSNSFTILPMAEYKVTRLNFSGTDAAFPIEDEDVHAISLSSFFLYSETSSPWIFGGWARAELATDFQHLNGDDVTFDVIAGVAYKFSDSLTVGLGGAVVNLNGDEEFYFGPAIDWKPSECFRAGLYGPNAVAIWTPSENWEFSLRGDTAGDEWNIRDADGNSTTLNFDSYRVGLFADRRLTGDLWLRVGGGVTIANEISYQKTNGKNLSTDDLDSGYFGEIALRLKVW